MLPLGLHFNWHVEDAIIYIEDHDLPDRQGIDIYTSFPWAAVYNRGKSYNIRMDDEVLVKFSPKNPTSSYCFGEMVRAYS
jgi:hypothetical protein